VLAQAALFVDLHAHHVLLNHDVAWLVLMSARALDGGHYATDFFEVNPPWVVLAYAPAALLARLLGISLAAGLQTWLAAFLLTSAVALHVALFPLARHHPNRAALLLALYGAVLFALPGYDYGQREHLIAASVLPCAVLLVLDPMAALSPRSARAWALSALAVAGAFLKPHFLVLVALAAAAAAARRPGALLRAPLAACALVAAVLYAGLLALRFPDWFEVARVGIATRGAYERTWPDLLRMAGPALAAATVLAALASPRACLPALARLARWLAVGAAASAVAFLVQRMGFDYHLLPAESALAMAAAAAIAGLERRPRRGFEWGRAAALAALALLVVYRELGGALTRPIGVPGPESVPLERALREPVRSLFVVSTSLWPAFPLVVTAQLAWGSRFPCLWVLPAVVRPEGGLGGPERERLARFTASAVAGDLERFRPDLVAVADGALQQAMPPGFDFVGFLSGFPAFRREWRHYAPAGRVEHFALYRRRAPRGERRPAR
jgi:hypothetical protein